MVRKVDFYHKVNGDCPVQEFLDSLSGKVAQKVGWTLELIENQRFVPAKCLEHLDDGIYEVRVKFGSDIFRILCFFTGGNVVLLTHGFVKKTQKTPPGEIDMAKKYRYSYQRRYRI
ncbi:MAG: type II toxin-antitoxin system RelE/ParE family toxin [Spirochaetes bacterium]|nr:type II toxin-antitoxin system RelE/ParE family toxin [Spirochaetota bacterium]